MEKIDFTKTPEDYLKLAEDAERRRFESFENSDTDGFLSQAAMQTMAQVYRLMATLRAADFRSEFPALFDLNGNVIKATLMRTRYGFSWGILADANPHGRITDWFNPSQASKPSVARSRNAAKGYYVGTVKALATVDIVGRNWQVVVVRADGGYSDDVEIIDNGQGQS